MDSKIYQESVERPKKLRNAKAAEATKMTAYLNRRDGPEFDLNAVMLAARREPAVAAHVCRRTFGDMEKGRCRQLYLSLAAAYGISEVFIKEGQKWVVFGQDDCWRDKKKKPRPDDEPSTVLEVMVFFMFEESVGYNRSWKYARV